MGFMAGRPTADVVVLYLTLIVGIVLVLTALAGLYLKITGDGTGDLLNFEGDVIKSFTAIIIGYLAGRGVNGRRDEP